MNKKKIIIRSCCFMALMLLLPYIIYKALFFYALMPSSTTRLSRYSKVRSQLDEPLKSLFPETIPMDSSRARFSYWEGVIGGGWMQLRLMKQTPKDLDDAEIRIDRIKIPDSRVSPGIMASTNGTSEQDSEGEASRYAPKFYTADHAPSGSDDPEFPDDYKLRTLYSEGGGGTNLFIYGVAISRKRGEIVYWSEIVW